MTTVITILYGLVCVLLIGIILVNPSKGGNDLGSIFGSGGGSPFGASSEDVLTKTTKIVIFFSEQKSTKKQNQTNFSLF